MTATNLRVVPAAPAPARWLGRVLAIAVIVFFAIFFVVPLAWLLLAPTKNGDQLGSLHGESPFSFGSFDQLAHNWHQLTTFQDGIIWTWLGNSVFYSGVALVVTILITIPAGYALAMTKFRLRRALLITTLMVMLIPNTALDRAVNSSTPEQRVIGRVHDSVHFFLCNIAHHHFDLARFVHGAFLSPRQS